MSVFRKCAHPPCAREAVYASTLCISHCSGGELEFAASDESHQTHPQETAPIPMVLWCPQCGKRHVDAGKFARQKHHTHACQTCGHCWRPAVEATVGVRFLPGFKDEENP